ncbi:Trm112 family protein [Paracoccus endophyticus]|uniref:Trm112 family protein n=1 Tax=Paracoccus endophyticus TaxID=2233774 RepID=UPI000DD97264|nr:Trm112 family protein [Paracoccus endophyticus]
MLEALVCPLTHGRLDYDATRQELVSRTAGLAFPIRAGIPIMLIGEARQIKADDDAVPKVSNPWAAGD